MMKGTKKQLERKDSSVVIKVPEHGAVSSYSIYTPCHPSQGIMEPFDFFSAGIV